MEVFDWLFSWEGRMVWLTGTTSLRALKLALEGFIDALRYLRNQYDEYIFPGFQRYIERVYGYNEWGTELGWDKIIREHSADDVEAVEVFYRHLHDYYDAIVAEKADE